MTGTDHVSFARLGGDAHLAQSIVDILSTARGTRVMRRDYGSDLPLLIDAPMNGETIVDVYHATAVALDRWEPRFRLTRCEIAAASQGRMSLTLTGDVAGETVALDVAVGTARQLAGTSQ